MALKAGPRELDTQKAETTPPPPQSWVFFILESWDVESVGTVPTPKKLGATFQIPVLSSISIQDSTDGILCQYLVVLSHLRIVSQAPKAGFNYMCEVEDTARI